MKKNVLIEFVSDYVCPYCLVAKEALKQAIAELEDEMDVEIMEQPFELTIEPAPRVDTYHDEVRKSHYQVLVEPCKALGLDMKLPPAISPRPYTRLAFEGFYYAKSKGVGALYSEAVYKAYFIDEKDIGQVEVLAELAQSVGLDVDGFKQALEKGTYTKDVASANQYGRGVLNVKHVPTIFVDGAEITESIYTKEGFVEYLRTAATTAGAGGFFGCGPEGC